MTAKKTDPAPDPNTFAGRRALREQAEARGEVQDKPSTRRGLPVGVDAGQMTGIVITKREA